MHLTEALRLEEPAAQGGAIPKTITTTQAHTSIENVKVKRCKLLLWLCNQHAARMAFRASPNMR